MQASCGVVMVAQWLKVTSQKVVCSNPGTANAGMLGQDL